MAIAWPSSLPQVMNRDGHKRQSGDGRLKSATEVGPGKVRRLTASVVKPLVGDMWMTRVQLQRFEEWWEDDTKQGTERFWFPAIGLHGFPMLSDDGGRLLDGYGNPILISAYWLVQFSPSAEPPSWTSLGDDTWQVSLSLEVLP